MAEVPVCIFRDWAPRGTTGAHTLRTPQRCREVPLRLSCGVGDAPPAPNKPSGNSHAHQKTDTDKCKGSCCREEVLYKIRVLKPRALVSEALIFLGFETEDKPLLRKKVT